MLRRKLRESLTARIFLITFLILLSAGAVTFGLIAWAAPISYTAVVTSGLSEQAEKLVQRLAQTDFADCGPVLDEFIRSAGADVMLMDENGNVINTSSRFAVQVAYSDSEVTSTTVVAEGSFGGSGEAANGPVLSLTSEGAFSTAVEVTFADRSQTYELYISPHIQAQNLAVAAMAKVAPWLLAVLLVFSLLCAVIYSRYVTRPIVRLSGIAGKMAQMDFGWKCGETRRDEIGVLGKSLDELSGRLSGALKELKQANEALRGEMEQERELERQRLAFFSAASHELKTPVTILKGQLSGMLEEVGVYRDRDKYLVRSLGVVQRMESLIREILAIARTEAGDAARCGTADLCELVRGQLSLDAELLEQHGLRVSSSLQPGVIVQGSAALLSKAVENLISNAALYSPAGAELRVAVETCGGRAVLSMENTGVHIESEALPHLFEAFYRAEASRNRHTGGSGLGLYLVRVIMEQHHAEYRIENTGQGVRFTASFPSARQAGLTE